MGMFVDLSILTSEQLEGSAARVYYMVPLAKSLTVAECETEHP